jgi:hypothetical protein
MQAIKDQFVKCKDIFVQYKIFVPILATLLIGLVITGFTLGREIEKVKTEHEVLIEMNTKIDSLMRK